MKIELRCWDRENKKMLNHVDCEEYTLHNICDWDGGDFFVFMFYTGLKDENGKEIFEGDILKTPYGNYAVEYEAPNFQLQYFDHYGVNGECPDLTEGEVVGNIYENENLLQK